MKNILLEIRDSRAILHFSLIINDLQTLKSDFYILLSTKKAF